MAWNTSGVVINGVTYEQGAYVVLNSDAIAYSSADATNAINTYGNLSIKPCYFYGEYEGGAAPYHVGNEPGAADGYFFMADAFPDATSTSYSVVYSGNGNDGETIENVPETQTKEHDVDLVLSDLIPIREGYTFHGWRGVFSAAENDRIDYQPGDTFTENRNVVMHAIWGANITYHSNAPEGVTVSNMPEDTAKNLREAFTIPSTIPTAGRYSFIGWATSQEDADAGTVTYSAEDVSTGTVTYNEDVPLDLYAVWVMVYDAPTVSNLTLVRCDENGTATAIGKYLKISFNWTTDEDLAFGYGSISCLNGYQESIERIDTSSGNISRIIGGDLSPLKDYTVWVDIADTVNSTVHVEDVLTAEAYLYPIITNLKAVRADADRNEDDEGTCGLITFNWTIDEMDGSNSLSGISVGYREHGSGTGYVNEVAAEFEWDVTSGTATAFVPNGVLNTGKSYDFIVIVEDQVSSTTKYAVIAYAFYTMDFKAGGKGVAIGKAATNESTFDVNMVSWFRQPVLMDVVDANQVGISSLTVAGREYGENQILWDSEIYGAMHMNGDQSVILSGAISEQPNGIVLVFSGYDNDAAKALDSSINTFFVSKKQVELFNKNDEKVGHTFIMGINAGFSVMGAKYLYFTDEIISGHVTNTASGTADSGITFNNSKYVLRYVIGV